MRAMANLRCVKPKDPGCTTRSPTGTNPKHVGFLYRPLGCCRSDLTGMWIWSEVRVFDPAPLRLFISICVRLIRGGSQRSTDQFLVVSDIDVFMGKSRGGPCQFSAAKWGGWLDYFRSADFLATGRGEPGLDQFAAIVEEETGIPMNGDVDARAAA